MQNKQKIYVNEKSQLFPTHDKLSIGTFSFQRSFHTRHEHLRDLYVFIINGDDGIDEKNNQYLLLIISKKKMYDINQNMNR